MFDYVYVIFTKVAIRTMERNEEKNNILWYLITIEQWVLKGLVWFYLFREQKRDKQYRVHCVETLCCVKAFFWVHKFNIPSREAKCNEAFRKCYS